MRFEWDEAKNKANFQKHGVRFEEAAEIFDDPWIRSKLDRRDADEPRWQSVGMARGLLLMFVAHTSEEGDGDLVVRLISARHATKQEKRNYAEGEGT